MTLLRAVRDVGSSIAADAAAARYGRPSGSES
jgi:hypothetical protein